MTPPNILLLPAALPAGHYINSATLRAGKSLISLSQRAFYLYKLYYNNDGKGGGGNCDGLASHTIQWNPVNTDTMHRDMKKCPYYPGVRIKWADIRENMCRRDKQNCL